MSDKKYVFDLNKITYAEVIALGALENSPVEEEALTRDLMVKAIVEWPYEGKPTAKAILSLGLIDFAHLQEAFTTELQKVFKRFGGSE